MRTEVTSPHLVQSKVSTPVFLNGPPKPALHPRLSETAAEARCGAVNFCLATIGLNHDFCFRKAILNVSPVPTLPLSSLGLLWQMRGVRDWIGVRFARPGSPKEQIADIIVCTVNRVAIESRRRSEFVSLYEHES